MHTQRSVSFPTGTGTVPVPGRITVLRSGASYERPTATSRQTRQRRHRRFPADLGIGLLQATILLVTFVSVLWALSADFAFPVAGRMIPIPGYMVWAGILYAGSASVVSYWVGRNLIGRNAERYAREADLRFSLVRVNEHIDAISLAGGETDEARRINLSTAATSSLPACCQRAPCRHSSATGPRPSRGLAARPQMPARRALPVAHATKTWLLPRMTTLSSHGPPLQATWWSSVGSKGDSMAFD